MKQKSQITDTNVPLAASQMEIPEEKHKRKPLLPSMVAWHITLGVILLFIVGSILVANSQGNAGEDVGDALLLLFMAPIILCTVAIDVYKLIKKLTSK
jgi:hypothetical protein